MDPQVFEARRNAAGYGAPVLAPRHLPALPALALCALLSAAPLRAEPDAAAPARRDDAPLALRTQGTLRELFLDVTAADARAVERPELTVRYSFSNIWNEPMTLTRHGAQASQALDEQADTLDVKLRAPWSLAFGDGPSGLPGSDRPLFRRLSTALEVRLTEHWGGWSDGFIEGWHGLVGAFDFRRDKNPRNQIALRFADDGGTAFDIRGSRTAFGDVVLRTQAVLAEGGAPVSIIPGSAALPNAPSRYGLSARLDLKLPTGLLSRAGGSGGVDVGAALLGTAELSQGIVVHAMIAASYFSPLDAPVLVQVRPWHWSAEVSAVFDPGPFQIIVEDRFLGPLLLPGWNRVEQFGDNGYLSSGYAASFRPHNQISWAIRAGAWSLWLSEDFTPGKNPRSIIQFYYESNSPDLTIGLAWTHRL